MAKITRRWSVPASILLLGEYAITRPGGMGIALATAPRAHGWMTAGPRKSEGSPLWGGTVLVHSRNTPGERATWPDQPMPLMDAVLNTATHHITPDLTGFTVEIGVDTTAFFDPHTGEKLGFGSSGAAAVLLTTAILSLPALMQEATGEGSTIPVDHHAIIATATESHRAFQGGRGSGYDIACSVLGGAVLFTNGTYPPAVPVSMPEDVEFYTLRAGAPVRSAAAIQQFDVTFPPGSTKAREFISVNNRAAQTIAGGSDTNTLFKVLTNARQRSEELGTAIGVPADLPLTPASHRSDGWIAKSSGAGNERAVIVSSPQRRRPLPAGAQPLTYREAGLETAHGPWRAEARGKLLLFGEHAAVFGYPAVGITLSAALRVALIPGGEWSTPEISHPDLTALLHRLEEETSIPAGELHISSDLPLRSGFGSSAALTVACARLSGVSTPEDVWRLAHRWEHIFHGTPSGIDTGLSALEGAWMFQRTPGVEVSPDGLPQAQAITLPELHLVVGSVPRTVDTRALISHVRDMRTAQPAETNTILQKLGEIATAVGTTGLSENAQAFGEAATEAQRLLDALGVVSDEVAAILSAGIVAGALGGKMSGAGGGGAFFLVCPDAAGAAQVMAALQPRIPPGGSLFVSTHTHRSV